MASIWNRSRAVLLAATALVLGVLTPAAQATTVGSIQVSGPVIVQASGYALSGVAPPPPPVPDWSSAETYTVNVTDPSALGSDAVVCLPGSGVSFEPAVGWGVGYTTSFDGWLSDGYPQVQVFTADQLPATVAVPDGSGTMKCYVSTDPAGTITAYQNAIAGDAGTPLQADTWYGIDNAWSGNGGWSEQFQVARDDTAPTISLSGVSSDQWVGAATVKATAGQSPWISGLGGENCTTNGRTPSVGTPGYGGSRGPLKQVLNYAVTADGDDHIQCAAFTEAGVQSPVAAQTVHLDAQTPTVTFPGLPSSQGIWINQPTTVNATATEATNVSGMAREQCSLNGGVEQTVSGDGDALQAGANSVSLTDPVAVPNGRNTLTCTATTNAGISSPAVTTRVNVDTQAPSVQFFNDHAAWQREGELTAEGSEPTNISGIGSLNCSLDGTAVANPSITDVTGDGEHTATCTATTGAGVSSPPETENFFIDNQTPTVAFSGAGTVSGSTAQVTVTGSETNNVGGIASLNCVVGATDKTVTGPQALAVGGNAGQLSETVTLSQPGVNQIWCTARTNAGATDTEEATITLNSPPSAPTAPVSSGGEGTATQTTGGRPATTRTPVIRLTTSVGATASPDGRITVRGRLSGIADGSGHVKVAIKIRADHGGGWRTVAATVQVRARGAWRVRLPAVLRSGRYQLRAVVSSRGASRKVKVAPSPTLTLIVKAHRATRAG